MKKLNEGAYSLIGIDGNAFSVMGYVAKAMRACKHNQNEIDAYLDDAKSSDYNHLLQVSIDMIEMLNKEKGYEDGHQFTKPMNNEWESCKVKVKNAKKINEEYNKETMSIPYDAYNVLTYAISDAFIKLWDEYNMEFTKKEGKRWLREVVRGYDFNKLSIAQYMTESANINEDVEFNDDIHFDDYFETKFIDPLTPNQECIYFTEEDMDMLGLSIADLKNILSKYSFTTNIINGKDVQIIKDKFQINDFIKLKRELCNILHITNIAKYIYNSDTIKEIL